MPHDFPPSSQKEIAAAVRAEDEAAYQAACARVTPWLKQKYRKEIGVLNLHMGTHQHLQDGALSGSSGKQSKLVSGSVWLLLSLN